MTMRTDVSTYADAVKQHGQELIDAVLSHHRHHHDDRGRPYWIEAELAETIELVEIERRNGRKNLG
jgi:hypothetical protein